MALNNSGPISLGGSTVGQSINLELGVSATALASINSTPFRNLAGVASGAISLSNFYGKSSVTYYLVSVTPTSGGTWYDNQQFDIDSSGNMYGALQGGSGSDNTLLKVSPTGASYATYVSTYTTAASNTRQGETMCTAPLGTTMTAGNIFLSAFDANNRATWSRGIGVSFVNASGTQSVYGGAFKYNSGAGGTQVYSNATCSYRTSTADSSGNFYFTFLGTKWYFYGYCPCSGSPIYDTDYGGLVLVKFNSNLTLAYSTVLGDGTAYAYTQANNAIAAANGGVFVIGSQGNPNTSVRGITYTNSSGVIQWAKYYAITTSGFSNTTNEIYGCADSSSNAFLIAPTNVTSLGRTGVAITKVNSSGVHQWTRAVIPTSSYDFATRGGWCDSSGNVYFSGTQNASPFFTTIVKYSSAGVFQWGLNITTGSSSYTPNGRVPRVLSNGAIILAIPTYSSWTPYFFLQLPQDGSKTGTYTVGGKTVTVATANMTSYDLASSESTRTNQLAYSSSVSTVGISQSTAGAYTATLAFTTL